MYQYEKRLDCRALGKEIKRRRKAKGWTQELWPVLQTLQTALAHADRAQHEERGFKACRWPDPNRIANMGKEGKLVLTKDKTRAD
jgi:hypothetical protein